MMKYVREFLIINEIEIYYGPTIIIICVSMRPRICTGFESDAEPRTFYQKKKKIIITRAWKIWEKTEKNIFENGWCVSHGIHPT